MEALQKWIHAPQNEPLRALPAVQARYASGEPLADAAWECILDATKQLTSHDRALLDVALNLGLLAEAPDLDASVKKSLYRDSAEPRRKNMLANWQQIHLLHQEYSPFPQQ